MQVDFNRREVSIKLVYSGPALSGKTTNLKQIHTRVDQRQKGDLMTLATHGDRTLFFDLLPLKMQTADGITVRLKVYTVPGQVHYNATRRIVLAGADGVAFVADSQVSETEANNLSYTNLWENLLANGIAMDAIPVVVQFNKRDLPDVRSQEEIETMAEEWREPVFTSVATEGHGVLETFVCLLGHTWDAVCVKYGLAAKFGVEKEQFLREILSGLGIAAGFDSDSCRVYGNSRQRSPGP